MQPNEKAVYIIARSPHTGDQVGTQLALQVKIWAPTFTSPATLSFYDTTRTCEIPGKTIKVKDDGLTFQDRNGAEWELRELTIEEYRHRLEKMPGTGDKAPEAIKTTESLWEWYRNAFLQ